jgi:hypothetical protein
LDALPPNVLVSLVDQSVAGCRDDNLFDDQKAIEDEQREYLEQIANNWDAVCQFLDEEAA